MEVEDLIDKVGGRYEIYGHQRKLNLPDSCTEMPLMYSCNLEQIDKSTCVSLPRVMLELVPFPFLHFAFSSAKNRRRAEEAMRINLAASGVKFVLFRRQVTTFSILTRPSLSVHICPHARGLSSPNCSPFAPS